jgi:cell division protein FtsL
MSSNINGSEYLFEIMVRVVQAAETQQLAANSSIQSLNDAIKHLSSISEDVKVQIAKELEKSIVTASKRDVDVLRQELQKTKKYAEQVTEEYRHAASRVNRKLYSILWISLIAVPVVAGFLVHKTIPTKYEIQVLNSQKKQLEDQIGKLESKTNIKFEYCADGKKRRLCVKTNEREPVYEKGYRILDGH